MSLNQSLINIKISPSLKKNRCDSCSRDLDILSHVFFIVHNSLYAYCFSCREKNDTYFTDKLNNFLSFKEITPEEAKTILENREDFVPDCTIHNSAINKICVGWHNGSILINLYFTWTNSLGRTELYGCCYECKNAVFKSSFDINVYKEVTNDMANKIIAKAGKAQLIKPVDNLWPDFILPPPTPSIHTPSKTTVESKTNPKVESKEDLKLYHLSYSYGTLKYGFCVIASSKEEAREKVLKANKASFHDSFEKELMVTSFTPITCGVFKYYA